MPVPTSALVPVDPARDDTVAGGLCVCEDALAGLYDVHTAAAARRRGLARALHRRLLCHARRAGATAAYLRVDAGNAAARAVPPPGFRRAYAYHYRARDPGRF